MHDSSVGGPLLWPADEPRPYCDEPHGRHATPTVHSPAFFSGPPSRGSSD
ncbi:hypothetical protein [Streptomyces sp. RKAG290]|nr:hypothetical protein [Streptomyces sp. RKAG290]